MEVDMALELKELNEEERLALVALLETAIAADSQASDGEAKQVRDCVAAMGKKAYQAAAAAADERFNDEAELWQFLATITRPAAREMIYEALLETILVDGPRSEETRLLDRLSAIWKVKARIVDAPK